MKKVLVILCLLLMVAIPLVVDNYTHRLDYSLGSLFILVLVGWCYLSWLAHDIFDHSDILEK